MHELKAGRSTGLMGSEERWSRAIENAPWHPAKIKPAVIKKARQHGGPLTSWLSEIYLSRTIFFVRNVFPFAVSL